VGAANETSHYDRDAADLHRTRDALVQELNSVVETYKQIAQRVDPAADGDDARQAREAEINAALQLFSTDLQTLPLYAHLLTLDVLIDKGGELHEQFIRQRLLIEGFGAKAEDLDRHERDASVGMGGLVIGYALAKASAIPPEDVFADKTPEVTWLDLMKKRGQTLATLQPVLEAAFPK